MFVNLPEPRVVDLDGLRVAYVDRDPGTAATPLVLLHGGAVDHRMWAEQINAFPERRVVAPDARGHGRSSTPTEPYRLCDDVVMLLDALEIERAILVGLSMGGGTAVDTALEHPDRVAALVVSGTGTSQPEFTDPWVLDILAMWQRAQQAADADGWIDAFMRFMPGPHRDADDVDSDVYRRVETMARATLATHVVTDAAGTPVVPPQPIPVADPWSRVPQIDVPVLAVAGNVDADDHIHMTRRLAESVPSGRFVMVDNSAHYPNMEQPQQFNAVIASFLETC